MTHVKLPPDAPLLADGAKLGGWWHTVDADENRILCTLCPRECSLRPGDRGFCFVRENRDGQMVLSTYGRSTGFCIDPIEKKPLNHFLPGTSVLSFGTAGCNLACKFCQNWSISKSREVERLSESAGPEAIARAAHEHGCRSVAYTYNDPIIWAEYAMDVAAACRAIGIRSVAVTAGYITPAAREPFFRAMDAANVDLKAFTEEFYHKLTLSHLQPVLDTLAWIKQETDVWFEVTNLVIPDANDSSDELRRLCDWMLAHIGDSVPIHFSAFHPDFRLKDRDRTPHETLLRGYEIAKSAGLKYAYVGNVHDLTHQSTYCPNCQEVLIHRDWYELGGYNLVGNQCKFCNTVIDGVFERAPGTWGRQRMPVRISDYRPTPAATQAEQARDAELLPVISSSPQDSSQEALTVSTDAVDQPTPPEINDEQQQIIIKSAAELVACAVHGYRAEASDPTLGGAATQAVSGCFVTLKRDDQLRGCCGTIGRIQPMMAALADSATATATNDPRMPSISPTELEYLSVSVSLLHTLKPVTATGQDRMNEIEIGRHGLQLIAQNQRGLLLPNVPTEQGWDKEQFMRQICLKAGLPPTFWKSDAVQLWTFESTAFSGPFPQEVITRFGTSRSPMFTAEQIDHLAAFCTHNVATLVAGGTPTFYTQGCPDGTVEGITLSLTVPGKDKPARFGQISMRPGFQMQPAALELCKVAAGLLQAAGFQAGNLQGLKVDVAVLTDPAMHGTLESPTLAGYDPQSRALMVSTAGRSAFTFDPTKTTEELLTQTTEDARARTPASANISSLTIATSAQPMTLINAPKPQMGPPLRAPAVAGAFYPKDEEAISRELEELFPTESASRQSWRACMVPHAGWKYSGQVAAAVLNRVEIPETVIVLSPKHTRLGVDWAVAPHDKWIVPGGEIESDPELAQELAEAIDDLELDGAAHVREHGIEVELPLIAHVNPNAKVVGIAMGGICEYEDCQAFAKSLAEVLQKRDGKVLLVISSDMNHYANEEDTRRLDEMAMNALESLKPADVLSVVRENQITMCGVIPAVIALETLQQLAPLQKCERVGYATSAAASGNTDRVVGYAGMLFD